MTYGSGRLDSSTGSSAIRRLFVWLLERRLDIVAIATDTAPSMRPVSMRAIVAILVGAAGFAACKQERRDPAPAMAAPPAAPAAPELAASAQAEGTPPVAAFVGTGEAALAHQLLEGFHEIEEGSWRWTKQRFAVSLLTPASAREKGAKLRFSFAIPPPALDQYAAQEVSAKIATTELASQAFEQAGSHEFVADVPASALQSDVVRVDFALSKSFSAKPDVRELGVVAHSIGLEAK